MTIKERSKNAFNDLLKIIATPFAIAGLELAAIYGMFSPYNGRKLYASAERVQYERHVLAPCFQPNPKSHFFGGDINEKNAF